MFGINGVNDVVIIVIGIIIVVVLFNLLKHWIIYGILRRLFKLFFILFLVILVLFAVSGYLVFWGADDFKTSFVNSSKLVVLEDRGNIVAGFYWDNSKRAMSDAEMANYTFYLREGSYKFLPDNTGIVRIKSQVISELKPDKIGVSNYQLTRADALAVLESADPTAYISTEFSVPKTKVKSDLGSNEEIKARLLSIIFLNNIAGDPLFFFEQYRKDNIIVYPETVFLKLMRVMPLVAIKEFSTKFIGQMNITMPG